jgi:hypothetical protein
MQQIIESLEAIVFGNNKNDPTITYMGNKSQDKTGASCMSDSTNDMPSDDFNLCLSNSMQDNECNSDIITQVENMSILSNNTQNTKTRTSRKGISNKIDNTETQTLRKHTKKGRRTRFNGSFAYSNVTSFGGFCCLNGLSTYSNVTSLGGPYVSNMFKRRNRRLCRMRNRVSIFRMNCEPLENQFFNGSCDSLENQFFSGPWFP